MKSNGTVIDTTQGVGRESTEQKGAGRQPASLRVHIRDKDYDGIARDAATLETNFTKVDEFWTRRKVDDAVILARTAIKAASDLEAAAKAKDDAAVSTSANALAATCRAYHQAHRVMQLTDKSFQIM